MLEPTSVGLSLRAAHHPDFAPLVIDWSSAEMRRRVAGGRRQLLARAVGLHKQKQARVLDATAGLGRDGFVLAALGAEVTMVERQPLFVALLRDARERALQDPVLGAAAARIRIIEGQASEVLAGPQDWDIVHLDPMYPHTGKRALPQKEMLFLRELTGGADDDARTLLEPARARCRRRVVVKRPVSAPCLTELKPDFQLRGSQARYDIYLPRGST